MYRELNEEQEKEFASHRAYTLHQDLFETKEHRIYVDKPNFFRSYDPAKARNTVTGLAIHSNFFFFTPGWEEQ